MKNNDIPKDLKVNSSKLGSNTYFVFFIACIICIAFSSKIYACFPINKVKPLWEKSQKIQKETSFVIDADYILSYVRLNGKKDSYKENRKFYKDGDKWRSEKIDLTDDNYVFISIYDGKELHDYVDVEDSNQPGKFNPTELSINKGMIIYDQMRKDGYDEESLEDIIAEFNSMDRVINWYPKLWYKTKDKECPKIKEKTKINNIECTYVTFSKNREACISEDYGIAVYYKESRDESKFPGTVNQESIQEYFVTKVRNSKKDIVHIDKKLFDLPDVKPWHIYGKY